MGKRAVTPVPGLGATGSKLVNFAMLGFLLYVFFSIAKDSGKQLKENVFGDLKTGAAAIDAVPDAAVQYATKTAGSGDALVRCGSEVSVRYIGYLPDGKIFEDRKTQGEPLVFKVGSNQVMRGLEQAVIGMKAGEQRRAVVPLSYAYAALAEKAKGLSPDATIGLEVELVSLTVPEGVAAYRVYDDKTGDGSLALCGREVSVSWKAYTGDDPAKLQSGAMSYVPGQGGVPLAMEQAVVGMRVGGKRTIIAPSRYQATAPDKDNSTAITWDFPANSMAILELELTGINSSDFAQPDVRN